MAIEVVVIGARGYTGSELLPLLYRHPACVITAVGSSSSQGAQVSEQVAGMSGCGLEFSAITAHKLQQFPAELFVLALPNGQAAEFVAAIEQHHPDAAIIDLSADYRFDPAWVYGQPERFADNISGARRIANPGCYATGAQLALAPLVDRLVARPAIFGVSGYSGAGKTPSRRNNPDILRDNLLPYSLAGHVHEQEITRHLGHEVRFLPHVAPFFRGISLTLAIELDRPAAPGTLLDTYRTFYQDFPLIRCQEAIPEVAEVRATHDVIIGGFTVNANDPKQVSLVCVLDNLLKGAATQVVQNINLAFGLAPLTGLDQLMREAEGEPE